MKHFKYRPLDEKGQGLTEYMILLMLIALVSIVAAKNLGTTVKKKITEAEANINKNLVVR